MLCERCKIREANIQYTEVIGGVKTEHNFCAQCAKELDFGPYSAIFDSDFPLGKLLSGLLGVAGAGGQEEQAAPQIVCPTCKTSYGEFIKNSRFGCQDCYGVFDLLISDNIKQLQGSDTHKGKRFVGHKKIRPVAALVHGQDTSAGAGDDAQAELEEQIRILDARRQEAVRHEDYETAALCRDEIRKLKEGSASI